MSNVARWYACLLWSALAGCSSFDGGALERRDSGAMDAAVDGGADAAVVVDAGELDAEAGALTECEPNPDALDEVCPQMCPERCNGMDDDCDRRIDEGADAICALSNATASCIQGTCIVVNCAGEARDCDGDPATGCESMLDTVDNCGACGLDCGALLANASATGCTPMTAAMPEGAPLVMCVLSSCAEGFADCDDVNQNGCETNLRSADDCNGCSSTGDNTPCATLPKVHEGSCADGTCQIAGCEQGFADCNGELADGCEWENAVDGCCGGDTDSDGDGVPDCLDACQNNPMLVTGCGPKRKKLTIDGSEVEDRRHKPPAPS